MILCYGNKIPQYWLQLLTTFRIQLSGIMYNIGRIFIKEKHKIVPSIRYAADRVLDFHFLSPFVSSTVY
jgi:hypothetical protein